MSKKLNILFVAVTLGLAWAMRGHFGHEWGASWAGAMGVLSVLLISKRGDWAARAPLLTALGAIGWGAGGMMSYGIVAGYCRSLSFLNSFYGYTMLAVIGGLYGFIGGGLFGLGLESTEKNKPKWAKLIVQMFTGGFLVWGLLIYQMEWFMTPPRSELWAACFGAALALAWFLSGNKFYRALRVAAYSALGAGFGFAFGNFIQTMGSASGIAYNWWNVMEFTLGFFGGLGMGYAVLTRTWPEPVKPSKTGNRIALAFVFLFIPFTNFVNGMNRKDFIKLAINLNIPDTHPFATGQIAFAGISLVLFFILFMIIWRKYGTGEKKAMLCGVPLLFFLTTIEYNLFSYIKLGTFYRHFSFRYSDSVYVFITAILFTIWYYSLRKGTDLPEGNSIIETWKRWGMILLLLLIILTIITFISVNSHGELPGAHNRF